MTKEVFINKEAFLRAKRLGKRNMKLLLVANIIFLMVYMASGFFVTNKLFGDDIILHYCILALIELIFWLVAIVMVWIESSLARLTYFLVNLLSLYGFYYLWQMFQVSMEDMLDISIRILFVGAYIGKTLLLFLSGMRLYQEPICYVWQSYEKEGREAEVEDQELIADVLAESERAHRKRLSNHRITKRALKNMRIYTILLLGSIYGGLVLLYLGGFVCKVIFQNDGDAMDYVQRFVLLSSLFSALIWSLPTVLLFLNHIWTKGSVIVTWLIQFAYYIVQFPNLLHVVQNEQYTWQSFLVVFLFEGLRIFVLFKISMLLWKDPFVNAYWKLLKDEE